VIPGRNDLSGVDDVVAELAFAKRAPRRYLADCVRSARRFTYPRRSTRYDALGYLVVDSCACIRPSGHDGWMLVHPWHRATSNCV